MLILKMQLWLNLETIHWKYGALSNRIYFMLWFREWCYFPKARQNTWVQKSSLEMAMALQVLQVKGIDRYRGSGKTLAKHLGKWLKKYILNVQVSWPRRKWHSVFTCAKEQATEHLTSKLICEYRYLGKREKAMY